MKSASVAELIWPSEKAETNSRSSEVDTVVMAASRENSRMICCDLERNGISSSSEAKKPSNIMDPRVTMPCWMPGWPCETATATLSSTQVPSVMMLKRRSTKEKGCGASRCDQVRMAIAAAPSVALRPWHHHQT